MFTQTLSLLVLLLGSMPSLSAHAASPLTVKEVRELGYFNHLNYENEEDLRNFPALEAKLVQSAELALNLPDQDPYFKESSLIFIYTALFMDNLIEAYHQGLVTSAMLNQEMSFSNTKTDADEISAREKKILQYVERAKQLLPNDIRMDSWVIGMKVKHLDPSYADTIIQMVKDHQDTFSLISAITVTKDLVLSSEQEGVLYKFVKRFTSLKSPCFAGKTSQQCRSTELAPYASQTGVVMMADYRLKMAKKEFSRRAQSIGRMMARMLYNSTSMVWMKASTPSWIFNSIVEERVSLTLKENFHSKLDDSYWKSRNARVLFRCTSCHTSGQTVIQAPLKRAAANTISNHLENSK